MLVRIEFASYTLDLDIISDPIIDTGWGVVDEFFNVERDAELFIVVDNLAEIWERIAYDALLIDRNPTNFDWRTTIDVHVTVVDDILS